MKKILVFALVLVFAASAPVLARTKYDKYGHKITPQKKTKVQAAAKVQNKNNQVDPEMKMRPDQMQQTQAEVKKEEKVKERPCKMPAEEAWVKLFATVIAITLPCMINVVAKWVVTLKMTTVTANIMTFVVAKYLAQAGKLKILSS